MEDNKNNPHQLNIELNEQVAEGTYANLAIVAHSGAEFVVDFVRVMPGVPKAKVVSRIIMTPYHAKRLVQALQENIAKFEKAFGPIDGPNTVPFPPTFGGPTGMA